MFTLDIYLIHTLDQDSHFSLNKDRQIFKKKLVAGNSLIDSDCQEFTNEHPNIFGLSKNYKQTYKYISNWKAEQNVYT